MATTILPLNGSTTGATVAMSADALGNPVSAINLPNAPIPTSVPGIIPQTPTLQVDPVKSMLDTYTQDTTDANISGLGGNVATANNALAQEQANLTGIQGQLQTLSTQAQVEGQKGNGGMTAFGNATQAEANREAAMRAIPLQAQSFASQAKIQSLQGNAQAAQTLLTQAQQQVDKLFQIQSTDAQNQYNYRQALNRAVYDAASTDQKIALDAKAQQDTQDFQLKRDELSRQHDVDMANLNNSFKTSATGIESLAQAQGNITNVSDLLKGGSGMDSAVGTNFLSRTPSSTGWSAPIKNFLKTLVKVPLTLGIGTVKDAWAGMTGTKQNFIAGTEQLKSQLSLDSLINAKKQGATFGALSDTEMNILSRSASKIGSWEVKDNDGNITGYNTTQKAFKAELDKINNFAKLDYLLKGGNPADVGVQQLEDGTYWTQNSDGSYTKLQ